MFLYRRQPYHTERVSSGWQQNGAISDGKVDIVCLSGEGKLRVYLNKGTKAEPKFDGYSEPESDKFSVIKLGYRGRVAVADFNADGKDDLIYGITGGDNKGKVYVFEAE